LQHAAHRLGRCSSLAASGVADEGGNKTAPPAGARQTLAATAAASDAVAAAEAPEPPAKMLWCFL